MKNQSYKEPVSASGIIVILGSIGLFYFLSVILPNHYDSGPDPNNKCKHTEKEIQTIRKIDGSVDSIETEMVQGCEYPDGTFLRYP